MKITTTPLSPFALAIAAVSIASTADIVPGCDAFAPVHTTSSSATRLSPAHPFILADRSTVSASATALNANLFDRFFRVTAATANNLLAKFEDPEKIMNQALEDMQTDLVRVRQTYAEVTATQRRMASSKRQLESQADDWHSRAKLALTRSNEGLAREALARREALLNQATGIGNQIDAQAKNIDTLYEGMMALEKKIVEAKGKQNEMAARARTAKSTQKINDMLGGLTGKTSMDAFNRMEDKVLALEAAAEVSVEMAKNTMSGALLAPSKNDKTSASSVEMQFRMLEASDSVDKELEKLKANMLPQSSSASSSSAKSVARTISLINS